MDQIRFAVEPLVGFLRPIDQVRIWINDREYAALHDRVGPEPALLLAADSNARAAGVPAELTVAMCSQCLDEGCGYNVAVISHEGETISWDLFEIWFDLETHRELDASFSFAAGQYREALHAAGLIT